MKRRRWTAAAAIGITATFLLAACGSDDNSSSTTGAPTTAGAVPPRPAGRRRPPGRRPRQAVRRRPPAAARLDARERRRRPSDLGLIDGVYKGSSDFEIDPTDCPEDWDPTQGITDTEIHLFTSLPTSGPFAGFGLLADGMKSYFKYINDNGGIDGRKIVLDAKDDGYAPDKTKTNVDEALGSGKYAALTTVLGTPNNLAVWDTTNDECMPQLFNATGAAQWGDVREPPVDHGHAARLLHRGLAVGQVAGDRAPRS